MVVAMQMKNAMHSQMRVMGQQVFVLLFGFFCHDWRVVPPAQWLELLGEREIAMTPQAVQVVEHGFPIPGTY